MTEQEQAPPAAGSPRWERWAAAALVAQFLVVVTRPYDGALFRGASFAAEWQFHAERLRGVFRWQRGDHDSLLGWLVYHDAAVNPPGLHAVAVVLGSVVGHGAEALLRAWILWAVLLVASAAVLGFRLAGRQGAWAAALCTAAIPAVHGSVFVYHHDLLQHALLWTGVAVIAVWQDRRPLLAGSLAGVLVLSACIVKWSTLLFGPPLLLAVLFLPFRAGERVGLGWLRRVLAAASCGAVVVLGLDAWFRRTTTSFVNLLDITWGEARPVPPEGLVTVLQHAVDVVSSARSEATPPADSWEAWLVPFHFVAFTLSPLLAVVLAAVLLLWLLRCRRGLAFAAIALLGEVAVIYLVAGPGDRWMLVLCPAFGVIAGLGFLQMKPRSLRVAAPVCVLLGLFLAVDYHHVLRSSAGRDAVSSVLGLPDAFAWRGLGAASSLDPVGWTRRDVKGAAPSFLPQKEALWSAVTACGAELVVVEDPGVQVQETPAWWHYRNQLEALDGDGDLRHIVTLAGSIYSADMVTPSASAPAVAMLLSERGDRPPAGELLGAGWSRGGTYPSGTPQWAPVTVWVRGEAASCAEP